MKIIFYNKIRYLILLYFLVIINTNFDLKSNIIADNASLSGYVLDSENEETIIGATIRIEGTKLGAYTNKSGFFSISNIPPGSYKVIVTSISYKKSEKKITFSKSQSIRETFKLQSSDVLTDEISVEASKEVERREISISKVNIPVKQLKQIRIGGEADVFRSLQYLPGVLTSSQISSGLFVRGGSPDQNLVLLDGATVYNPSHLFGFISTFNPEAIKDVELIKGGFPAEFGGRLSAVLNLTQKDGNRNSINGTASLGAISSRLSLEGPIGNGSWFIGGRRTYFDLIKNFIPDDPESPLPDFGFYDINFKVNQSVSKDDKLFLSGFMSKDKLDYSSFGFTVGLEVANHSASLRWTHIFGDDLFFNLNLGTSRYTNKFNGDQSGFGFLVDNIINDINAKGTLEWFASDNLTFKSGFEAIKYDFTYYSNFTGNTDTSNTSGTVSTGLVDLKVVDWNYSFFLQGNYQLSDLASLQGGIRAFYLDFSKNLMFEPRLALRYQLQENAFIKFAYGLFHQNLRLATQPDFSFFDTWLPTDSSVSPSKAEHYILSLETKPYEDFDLNFDFYYKKMDNISELNNNILSPSNVASIFYIGKGESYGAEVFLQKKVGKLVGWIGYALGFISSTFDSINGGQSFRPKYDRRHDLKIVGQYQINDDWEVGASFTFQSGQSYTGATSRYVIMLPEQNQGRSKIVPSQRYGLRLPNSHQLNLNATYNFKMLGLKSKLIFDIYNVYNRRDIWFRYYDTRGSVTKVEDVKLLPIIPTVSLEVKF